MSIAGAGAPIAAEAPGSRASIAHRALAAVRGHEVQAPPAGDRDLDGGDERRPFGPRRLDRDGGDVGCRGGLVRADHPGGDGLRAVERRAVGLGEGHDDRRLGAGPDAARHDEHAQVIARAAAAGERGRRRRSAWHATADGAAARSASSRRDLGRDRPGLRPEREPRPQVACGIDEEHVGGVGHPVGVAGPLVDLRVLHAPCRRRAGDRLGRAGQAGVRLGEVPEIGGHLGRAVAVGIDRDEHRRARRVPRRRAPG